MESLHVILLALIIGITGGLFAIFYRNTLKMRNMVLAGLYDVFNNWVMQRDALRQIKLEEDVNWIPWYVRVRINFLSWVSYPLGYCIYCSGFWITALLWIGIMKAEAFTLWFILAASVQHIVIAWACYTFLRHEEFSYSRWWHNKSIEDYARSEYRSMVQDVVDILYGKYSRNNIPEGFDIDVIREAEKLVGKKVSDVVARVTLPSGREVSISSLNNRDEAFSELVEILDEYEKRSIKKVYNMFKLPSGLEIEVYASDKVNSVMEELTKITQHYIGTCKNYTYRNHTFSITLPDGKVSRVLADTYDDALRFKEAFDKYMLYFTSCMHNVNMKPYNCCRNFELPSGRIIHAVGHDENELRCAVAEAENLLRGTVPKNSIKIPVEEESILTEIEEEILERAKAGNCDEYPKTGDKV